MNGFEKNNEVETKWLCIYVKTSDGKLICRTNEVAELVRAAQETIDWHSTDRLEQALAALNDGL